MSIPLPVIGQDVTLNEAKRPNDINPAHEAWEIYKIILNTQFRNLHGSAMPYIKDHTFIAPYAAELAVAIGNAYGATPVVCQDAAVINLALDHAGHLLDDVMDSGCKPEAEGLLLAFRLQLFATTLCTRLIESRRSRTANFILENLKGFIDLAIQAEFACARRSATPYKESDYEILGRRFSYLKMPLVIHRHLRVSPSLDLEPAVDSALIALQLVDDIIDWRVDYRSGIFTNSFLVSARSHGDFATLDLADLNHMLISTGATQDALQVALQYALRAELLAKKGGGAQLATLFTGQGAKIKQLHQGAEALRRRGGKKTMDDLFELVPTSLLW